MRGLPRKVKGALEKARDSALLAVEVYNKPAVKFKSGYGYTQAWVDFLIEKLKDTTEFDALCKSEHASGTASQST